VVFSHYQVDLEAVSTGYVVPVNIDDEVAMNRADALAAPAADILAEDSWTSSIQMLLRLAAPKPEDH
jgi:hypothetical protein